LAQSGIGGCARATSGRAAVGVLAVAVTGAGDGAGDAVVAGALAHPTAAATASASDGARARR
jgi:hypothetical protein